MAETDVIDGQVPAFEIGWPDGNHDSIQIYVDGRTSGLVTTFNGGVVFNRLPILIEQAEARGLKRGEAIGMRWAFAAAAAAFLILAFLQWLGIAP